MASNCTGELLYSREALAEVGTVELVLYGTAGGFTFIVLLLFLEEIVFFWRRYSSAPRRTKILLILFIYPVIAVTCMTTLLAPRTTLINEFALNIVLAVGVYQLPLLVTDYMGGAARMVKTLSAIPVALNMPPCCCCVCIPRRTLTRRLLRRMKLLVLQGIFVRPVFTYIAAVLYTDDRHTPGTASSPIFVLCAVVLILSFLCSLYGLVFFVRAADPYVPQAMLKGKLVCVVLPLVLVTVQKNIIVALSSAGIAICTAPFTSMSRGNILYAYVLIVEMFLLSLLARALYRRPDVPFPPPPVTEDKAVQCVPPEPRRLRAAKSLPVVTEEIEPLTDNLIFYMMM
ncbi:organic solute transporter subunit alpha-like [Branchiostoma lanceolatum]|uniref:organic solute transporter subunit alpha-like n=1 Tax=Branchiostoma lanceolatum TaxID=7740 RepID=UPI003455CF02